jgi:hypothetical protein
MVRRNAIVEILVCLFFTVGAESLPVRAQSTNAAPNLSKSNIPYDADKASGLPAEAKKAVTDAQAKFKSGDLLGFVFVASPGFKIWALNGAPKGDPDFNLSDLARRTLETCEYGLGQPCAIVSINGFDTHEKSGEWPKQPPMLFWRPSEFDLTVLPFVPATMRAKTDTYRTATGPRAFAVTTSGAWVWRPGATPLQAIDKTMADCSAQSKNAPCLLYAVNNRVVFGGR